MRSQQARCFCWLKHRMRSKRMIVTVVVHLQKWYWINFIRSIFVGQAVSAHGETDLVLLALEALRRMALQERVVDVVDGWCCWLIGWLMLAPKSFRFFNSLFSFVFERIICSNPHVGRQLQGNCIDWKVTKERCPKLTLLAQEPEDQKEYLEVPRVADGFQKQIPLERIHFNVNK